jgi:HAMP domain-containing protein
LLFERVQDIRALAIDELIEELLRGGETEELVQEKLDESLLLTGPWYELEIFSKEGVVVASVEPDEIGETFDSHDPGEFIAYTVAMQGEVYVSDVFISTERGIPIMIFAAPVRDEQSTEQPVVGVVMAILAWPVVSEIIESVSGYDAYLLNNKGEEVAISVEASRFSASEIESEELLAMLAEGTHFAIHKQGVKNPAEVLVAVASEQGHITYPGNGWWLVLETPTTRAFSSITLIIGRFLLVSFGIIILGVIISFIISRSITKPIIELKDAADKISKGNLDVEIEVKSTDEIGKLTESFSFMRASLKAVIKQYETMLQKTKKPTKKKNPIIKKVQEPKSKVGINKAQKKSPSTPAK